MVSSVMRSPDFHSLLKTRSFHQSCASTSGHQPGLDAAHADGDFSALILSRKDFDHSLQHLDVGIVYVPTAVIIHSGHGEAVLEGA